MNHRQYKLWRRKEGKGLPTEEDIIFTEGWEAFGNGDQLDFSKPSRWIEGWFKRQKSDEQVIAPLFKTMRDRLFSRYRKSML